MDLPTELPEPKESHFDSQFAQQLLGKYIVVGITYLKPNGDLDYLQQLHGIVKTVSEQEGISIELKGVYDGEEWSMPPVTSNIHEATSGIYRLRSTGEEVDDPDFTSTWKVYQKD